MLKRTITLLLTAILCVGFLGNAIRSLSLYKSRRNAFISMKNAVPTDMQVNFTKTGTAQAIFHHSSSVQGHGCLLYFAIPEHDSSGINADSIQHALANNCANIVFTDKAGATILQYPIVPLTQFAPIIADGRRLLPITRFFPTPRNGFRKYGDYHIRINVTNPTDDQRFSDCHIIAKYGWSGLEKLPAAAAALGAAVSAILAILFLIPAVHAWNGIAAQRRKPFGTHILYLITSYPRWSETFIRQDIRLLKEQGLPLKLVALFPGDCIPEPNWPQAEILKPDAPTPHQSFKYSLFHIPHWLNAKISITKHRALISKLLNLCRTNQIGHIHAEFADLAALIAAKIARKSGCSFSIGIHAFDIHHHKYPNWRLFGHAAFITACNRDAANTFKSLCPWAANKLHLLHHGIDLEKWHFNEQRPQNDAVNILFIGRLVPKKGLSILLKAIDLLINHTHQKASLLIIGDGPLHNELLHQAEQLNITQSVTFHEHIPQEQLQSFMSQASCLCVPSIVTPDGDRDGIPNVVTEAMAFGLPVVGSQAGSLPEVLTEETGWPVAPLSPATLADNILDAISQPDESQRRRLNARRQIEFRFDAKKIAQNRANLFRDVNSIASSNVF